MSLYLIILINNVAMLNLCFTIILANINNLEYLNNSRKRFVLNNQLVAINASSVD